ncbi:macrolide 2'-phosphotransferase [Kutzneria buriramensis]|uniref:Macrolide phosphotransferase n=1 Tax=Kutzneria buriramensis TaxID=1045776 RepID=A0A3E0HTP8_9PSEU|nr:macrolide 2'-phosphotransferase [Kutzneria buriramensis]REH49923.1 macrolide phosphotransferase [Kutzneria buriramensis]
MSPSAESMLLEAYENGLELGNRHEVDESGWDFLVLHATAADGTPWILRAPRRPGEYLKAEGALLDHVRPHLPIAVPDWRIHTDTLIAYPRLPGMPAGGTWLPADDRLGRSVAVLHALPTEPIEALGIPVLDPDDQRKWLIGRLETAIREFDIPDEKVRRWQDWLAATDRWPQDMVLARGDLHPQHLLVEGGRLVGMIDWADATISDPALDFIDPYHYLTPAAFDRLLADYERHGGHVWPGMREHIALRASFGPVIGGTFGLATGRDDLVAEAREELSRGR